MKRMSTLRWALGAAIASLPLSSSAFTITYAATDLTDSATADAWRYDYQVTGHFNAFEGFQVFFAPALYGALRAPTPSADPVWAVFVVQPDNGLPADGLFNATAQLAVNETNAAFSVVFDWLGTGIPGTQGFEFFDQNFDVLAAGQTSVVPIPAAGLLFAGGVLALSRWRRRYA